MRLIGKQVKEKLRGLGEGDCLVIDGLAWDSLGDFLDVEDPNDPEVDIRRVHRCDLDAEFPSTESFNVSYG